MKITILAPGSRGDVQPYVALGLGLQSAGYEVSITTHTIFESFVRTYGLGFHPITYDPLEVIKGEAFKKSITGDDHVFRSWINLSQCLKPFILRAAGDCWASCQTTDAIIYSPLGFYFAPHIAQKLNLPAIAVFYDPMYPTREFPSLIFGSNLGFLNGLSWFIGDLLAWWPARSLINNWRELQLNLESIPLTINYRKRWREEQELIIFCFSRYVIPKPRDWGDHCHITGYLFLDKPTDWQPPPDLADFLNEGPSPIYVGFGSMPASNPEETTQIVLRALDRTKQRGLLATGWGGLTQADLPDNVFIVESVPHDWLFPKMAAVIHHGGTGTVAAGLRAGIPNITIPFGFDHSFWGKRVADLGVGPKPIPYKKLSLDNLTNAINTALNRAEMRRTAANLGEVIRSEDGVGNAVDTIRRYLSSK